MSAHGPILYIDDDDDDHEIMKRVFKELQPYNELLNFRSCAEAFNYLKNSADAPFLILCDVNLPVQNGIELKQQIDEDDELRKKSIPFVFYSTSVDQRFVNIAYTQMTVQGFFKKENNYNDVRRIIGLILEYWRFCKHPNT
jgi:CheY-like chemotaxis protein